MACLSQPNRGSLQPALQEVSQFWAERTPCARWSRSSSRHPNQRKKRSLAAPDGQ